MNSQEAPYPNWRQTRIIVPIGRLFARAWFRAQAHGLEHLPEDRPVIYIAKHPRTFLYLETVILGIYVSTDRAWKPFRVVEQRNTSLHHTPFLAWMRRNVGAIPPTEEAALAELSQGRSLLIYPGGGRELYGPSDRVEWGDRAGFARLSATTGAPLVPVAIVGADQQHPIRLPLGGTHSLWLPLVPLPVRLDYWFGPPIEPPASTEPAAVAEHARAAARATQELLDQGFAVRRKPKNPASAVRQRRARNDAASEAAKVPIDDTRWYYRAFYVRLGAWLSRYHRLRFTGAPPEGPCIYVARHGAGYLNFDLVATGYALAWKEWYEQRLPRTRSLRIVAAESQIEQAFPGLPAMKRQAGLIDPGEASCLAVLERGEQLLLTPGGSREAQPSAPRYKLLWEGRHGFVRLALKTGATIVPTAVVGGLEAFPGFSMGKLSFWSPLPLPRASMSRWASRSSCRARRRKRSIPRPSSRSSSSPGSARRRSSIAWWHRERARVARDIPRTLVASDWHLGSWCPPGHAALALAFLARADQAGERVVLNGDIFEALFEPPGAAERAHPEVASAIAKLASERGLVRLAGNHDPEAGPARLELQVAGVGRVLISHGHDADPIHGSPLGALGDPISRRLGRLALVRGAARVAELGARALAGRQMQRVFRERCLGLVMREGFALGVFGHIHSRHLALGDAYANCGWLARDRLEYLVLDSDGPRLEALHASEVESRWTF